jgi:glyoxylase-like metal-dependent hydrolase (beta-lactamase superfamily II)
MEEAGLQIIKALACGVTLAALSPIALGQAQAPGYGAPPPAGHAPAPVVKEGTTVRISNHVYLIPDEKAAMVPNVGIIVGTKGTLVVDPGMGARSGQVVLREVQKLGKGGDLYIVNTHFHPEHTTGEVAFPAGAKILRAAAQQQDVDEMGVKWVQNFASRSQVIADVLGGFTAFRAPAEIFEREKVLDLGGVRVRILRLGPGHTRGDTVAYVEEDRVLFSGDLAMKDLFPAFATPQSASRTWLTSLDALDALKPRTVIGAHYPVTDASIISQYRDLIKGLQVRVAELKREGKSSDETGELLRNEFRLKYPDWAQPLRVHTAATRIYAELQ